MKKFLASIVFIALFATYTLYLHANTQVVSAGNVADAQTVSTQPEVSVKDSANQGTTQPAITKTSAIAKTAPTPTPVPAKVAAATPADKPKGQYKDGTYTGSSANAFYGDVQVQVTISGGKITNVSFLNYPSDRRQSEEINSYAMPQLKQQAIAAQSARVDGVSGATDTSDAFVQSLSSALSSAKA